VEYNYGMLKRALSLLASFALVYLAASVGASYTQSALSPWYDELQKAYLNPPSWVFAPVWAALYAFMAIAAWKVWNKRAEDARARRALWLYLFQLALTAVWSWAFFGAQSPRLAFGILIVLFGSVLATLILFRRIDRGAGNLLVPYAAWVAFAAYLNFSIVLLNPLR